MKDDEQMDEEMLEQLDTPPKSGTFVEHDELELTDEEIEKGNKLGRDIDINDDEDAGL